MLNFSIENSIAKIQLNRPESFNSITTEVSNELLNALDRCQEDDVRVVVLTGNGKAFCAGQDLNEGLGTGENATKNKLIEKYNPIISKIRSLKKPVIAAVNGVAAGAGASLALACDVIIAKESASFLQAFSKIGLVPDLGSTYFLPRLVGFQRASAWMMLADKISAKEAENTGMIYKCVADEEFDIFIETMAIKMSKMATEGLANTKALLNLSFTNPLDAQLAAEADFQEISSKTLDFKEGVTAFLEKRSPNFIGK